MNKLVSPFRWVGGKSSLSHEIMTRIPTKIMTYGEPFLGGGTIFLQVLAELRAQRYLLSDVNPHLINTWRCLKSHYKDLLNGLYQYKDYYDSQPSQDDRRAAYYSFRVEFNGMKLGSDPDPQHAALFMTLNKTSFNALVRYNSKGHFNSAFGKRDTVVMEFDALNRVNAAMENRDINFYCGDFADLGPFKEGDFVYMDPPYHVLVDRKVDDTTYTKEGFSDKDERRLRSYCDNIASNGGRFLMSNHDCPEILEYFRGFPYQKVVSYKCFTGKATSRKETGEILLGNCLPIDPPTPMVVVEDFSA
jgi:DNA adenine methylase